ncbi:MAG: hypothetical protein ACOX05_07045 [Bacillota bacterium]|jgi:hypothetical protein
MIKQSQTTDDKEHVIKQGLCNRLKNHFYAEAGGAILTSRRFIYAKNSSLLKNNKGLHDLIIPLTKISKLEQGRQGLNNQVLVIETSDGASYKFTVANVDTWLAAFTPLLAKLKPASKESQPTGQKQNSLCPFCTQSIEVWQNYCPHCGQALKRQ